MNIKRDSQLETIEEITGRLNSIDKQRDKLCSILNPRDWNKHNQKISNLTKRHDKLWIIRAKLIKTNNE